MYEDDGLLGYSTYMAVYPRKLSSLNLYTLVDCTLEHGSCLNVPMFYIQNLFTLWYPRKKHVSGYITSATLALSD
jgi:hypothetical protein